MTVILRVDVDNPYGWNTPLMLMLNYLRTEMSFPRIQKLGYLKHLKSLIKDLNDRGIPATFFLKTITIPKDASILKGHEIGLHVVYALNYNQFLEELRQLSRKIDTKIRGFSKHGSGTQKLTRKHAWQYSPRKYVEWAQRARLEYFSGNRENPLEKPYRTGNVIFFPSAFWLQKSRREERFNIAWLATTSEQRDIVVLLHPFRWGTDRQVREDYELVVSKINSFDFFPKPM